MYIIYVMEKALILLFICLLILVGCAPGQNPKIAYLSVDSTQIPLLYGDLHIMDVDGSNNIQLVTQQKVMNFLCWGPEGKRIAYVGLDSETLAQNLYVIDTDGENERKITDIEDHKKHIMLSAGCWNQDGNKILFTLLNNRTKFEDSEIFEVVVDESRMTELDFKGVGVTWASRGDKISLNANRTTSTGQVVTYIAKSDDNLSDATTASEGTGLRCGVRSFKDDKLICNGPRNRQNQRQLLFLDVETGEQIPISRWPVSGQGELIFTHMDWSPQNGKIMYTGLHLLNKEVDVYVMTTDGFQNVKLMNEPLTCCAAWSDR